jgi:cobalamin synthase
MPRNDADSTTPEPGAPDDRRAGVWIGVVIAAVLAMVVLPLMTFPLAALAFLGVACARSAIVNRQVGWVTGAMFGIVLTIAGLGGIAVLLAVRLGWRF